MLDSLRQGLQKLTRQERDPEVAKQVREAAKTIRINSRLLREVRAIQGELERPRPSLRRRGAAPWDSKGSSSR